MMGTELVGCRAYTSLEAHRSYGLSAAGAQDLPQTNGQECAAAGGDDLDAELAALVGELEQVSETELGERFDTLTMLAAGQPDDTVALAAVSKLIEVTVERGYVDQAMEMAMTLGAMACLHDHMQSAADEADKLLTPATAGTETSGAHSSQDGPAHTHEDEKHDSAKCKDCKAGKKCSKKR